jgi:acyl-CoA reductase-like NAD-dependent aldehyde dehydrogenase
MLKLADLIEKHAKELADLDSLTMGGPAGVVSALIGAAAATFRCEFPRKDIDIRVVAHWT